MASDNISFFINLLILYIKKQQTKIDKTLKIISKILKLNKYLEIIKSNVYGFFFTLQAEIYLSFSEL